MSTNKVVQNALKAMNASSPKADKIIKELKAREKELREMLTKGLPLRASLEKLREKHDSMFNKPVPVWEIKEGDPDFDAVKTAYLAMEEARSRINRANLFSSI